LLTTFWAAFFTTTFGSSYYYSDEDLTFLATLPTGFWTGWTGDLTFWTGDLTLTTGFYSSDSSSESSTLAGFFVTFWTGF
jgi:hypothetical protein